RERAPELRDDRSVARDLPDDRYLGRDDVGTEPSPVHHQIAAERPGGELAEQLLQEDGGQHGVALTEEGRLAGPPHPKRESRWKQRPDTRRDVPAGAFRPRLYQ